MDVPIAEVSTTHAIFIVRQVQENFTDKNRRLYNAFIDLEKAFDRVLRQVVRWNLSKAGLNEWLFETAVAMYVGASVRREIASKTGMNNS